MTQAQEPTEVRLCRLAAAQLGGEVLRVAPPAITVGCQELELELSSERLQAMADDTPEPDWIETVTEMLVVQSAQLRSHDEAWDDLRDKLVPVLWESEQAKRLAGRAAQILAYPYAGNLLVTLAWRLPEGLRYALIPHLELWAQSAETVLTAALANLRAATPETCLQAVSPGHYALDVDDGLDSSRLMILDELHAQGTANGLLAVVPARDVLSFVPFSAAGIKQIRALVNLATRCYAGWPQPISEDIYYIASETAVRCPMSRDASGAAHLTLPEELAFIQAELVNRGSW